MRGRIGAVAAVAALLAALTGCVASPPVAKPADRLPLGIPDDVLTICERDAGLGDSVPAHVWRDAQGLHVGIGKGSKWAAGTGISNTEYALLGCLTTASGMNRNYPSDRSGLLLLWRYSLTTLWPCFAQHGADLPPVPARETFLAGDPVHFDPLFLLQTPLRPGQSSVVRIACPLVPGYLTAAP